MNEEDRQFVLDNVDNINADVHDIDELCCALEHSTIFAVDYIQTFATRLIYLDYKYKNLQSKINKANELLEERKERVEDISWVEMKVEDYIKEINEIENVLKEDK